MLLFGASLAIYAQVRHFGFVFDDDEVVLKVADAHQGLTFEAVRWALGSFYSGNWFPLTLISHLADMSIFGLQPGAHHVENLAWHVLCAAAAFLVLQRYTASFWRSAFVAAVFAVHPLNVESVAWVAERKNLVSTFFFWLTLGAYYRYVRKPGAGRHLAVTAWYLLGLAAKSMLVTLPFLLLLLDFWPLGRLRPANPLSVSPSRSSGDSSRLFLEKFPWFLMAALVSIVAIRSQASSNALVSLGALPPGTRVANALVSWLAYLSKAIWPVGLAAYYPLQGNAPAITETLGAFLALVTLSFLALRLLRTRPYLATGWFWYVGTLVPVIGLVQIGNQALADRYAYLPLIGILVAIAWGCGDFIGRRRWGRIAAGVLVVGILAGFGLAARAQATYWHDNRSLFERALAVTEGLNPMAHLWLGMTLERDGDSHGAEEHYRQAIRQQPRFAAAHNNLGVLLARRGRTGEAIDQFREALNAQPRHAGAHYNLGRVLDGQGRLKEAIAEYRAALASDPTLAEAYNHLGIALAVQGDLQGAVLEFREALRASPGLEAAKENLERALAESRLPTATQGESR